MGKGAWTFLKENVEYRWWCLSSICRFASYVALLIVMPVYGALAFGECSDKEKAKGDDDCKFDYIQWQLYWGISLTMNSLLSYITGSIIGRWADTVGMSKLAALQSCMAVMPFIPLLFGRQFIWFFLALYIIKGLGSSSYIPLTAAITNLFGEEDRTLALASAASISHIGVFVGAACAGLSFRIKGAGGVPQIIVIMMFESFSAVMMFFFYPTNNRRNSNSNSTESSSSVSIKSGKDGSVAGLESTPSPGHSRHRVSQSMSTLRSEDLSRMTWTERYLMGGEWIILCQVDGLMYWLCRIHGMMAFTRSGIVNTSVVFYLDASNTDNEGRASIVSTSVSLTVAVCTVIILSLLVPMFKKYLHCDDVDLLVIGICGLIVSMILFLCTLAGGVLGFVFLVFASGFYPSGMLAFLANQRVTSDVLVDQDKTGGAFGLLSAWQELFSALGPAAFSGMFWIGSQFSSTWLFLTPGMICCLIILWMIRVYVRPAVADIKQEMDTADQESLKPSEA